MNETPLPSNISTILAKSDKDRMRRSTLYTTTDVDQLLADVLKQALQGRASHRPAGKAAIVLLSLDELPTLALLASDEGFASFSLRMQRKDQPDLQKKGSGVRIDCLPTNQSAIFAFSAGTSKIVRVLAHFLRPEGTREAQIQPSPVPHENLIRDDALVSLW
jgi:hypothetical protein